MKEKNKYNAPELSVITFTNTDVVTASVGSDNGFDGEVDEEW